MNQGETYGTRQNHPSKYQIRDFPIKVFEKHSGKGRKSKGTKTRTTYSNTGGQ